MEVEQPQQQVTEKRTADGLHKDAALGSEELAQQYRFQHFDVDLERWHFADVVSNGRVAYGNCYRDRLTGRPIVICRNSDSHYTLYIQVRSATTSGTSVIGFMVPINEHVTSQVLDFLAQTGTVYLEDLGELQVNAFEDVDEAEQARFLLEIKKGIAMKEVESELRAQLPPQQQQVASEERRMVKGRRRLGQ